MFRKIMSVVFIGVIFVSVPVHQVRAEDGSVQPRDTSSLEAFIDGPVADGQALLIDVRTPREFSSGHIPTAENIEYGDIAVAMSDVDRDTPIVVYCRSGNRSTSAYNALRQMGFTDVVNFGGIIHWDGDVVR